MSYSNPIVEFSYDGTGAVMVQGVPFYYLEGETSSIIAELWDYTDPNSPVQQSFILDTDYTIDESGYPSTVVTTTAAVPLNFQLKIYRSTEAVQTTAFIQGAFPFESVEETFDRAVMMAQEAKETLTRALLVPVGDSPPDLNDMLGDIAQNASDIAALGTPEIETLVPTALSITANLRDIVLVNADSLTITLPAPVLSGQVKVKSGGAYPNTVITHASGIDGYGASYTLSSDYESVSLVSDGTKWYII